MAAAAVNLYMLYAPKVPGPPAGIRLDLLAHFGSFAVLAVAGLMAGLRPVWFVPVLVVNAGLSELLQATVLPNRSGDWTDLVADLTGIAVGWWIAAVLLRSRRQRLAI